MISLRQMESLIRRTLSGMGGKFASDDAVEMVLVTGIVESGYNYVAQNLRFCWVTSLCFLG